jgi:hypothetical protein
MVRRNPPSPGFVPLGSGSRATAYRQGETVEIGVAPVGLLRGHAVAQLYDLGKEITIRARELADAEAKKYLPALRRLRVDREGKHNVYYYEMPYYTDSDWSDKSWEQARGLMEALRKSLPNMTQRWLEHEDYEHVPRAALRAVLCLQQAAKELGAAVYKESGFDPSADNFSVDKQGHVVLRDLVACDLPEKYIAALWEKTMGKHKNPEGVKWHRGSFIVKLGEKKIPTTIDALLSDNGNWGIRLDKTSGVAMLTFIPEGLGASWDPDDTPEDIQKLVELMPEAAYNAKTSREILNVAAPFFEDVRSEKIIYSDHLRERRRLQAEETARLQAKWEAEAPLRETKAAQQLELKKMRKDRVDTNSPAFKRWFGKSVVVDKQGKPLLVYHGSEDAGFTRFNLDKIDKHHVGFFFTSNAKMAGTYTPSEEDPLLEPVTSIREALLAQEFDSEWPSELELRPFYSVAGQPGTYSSREALNEDWDIEDEEEVEQGWAIHDYGGVSEWSPRDGVSWESRLLEELNDRLVRQGPGLYEVFLRIENPLVVDAGGANWEAIDYEGMQVTTNFLTREALADGYDGCIIKNVYDNGPHGGEYTGDVYVVFDPTQIKSAYRNKGTFDPGDADIRNPAPKAPKIEAPDTPEFKRWFGKSKVVDKKGKPLVVYHGTQDAGFSTFNINAASLRGAFFTSNRQMAASYAVNRLTDAFEAKAIKGTPLKLGVYSVFLSLQNPLEIDAKGATWNSIPLQVLHASLTEDQQKRLKTAMKTQSYVVRRQFRGQTVSTSGVCVAAHLLGYDGVIIRNCLDYMEEFEQPEAADIFVAFEPTQIKSANHNRGTFDPGDADIRNPSREAPAARMMRAGASAAVKGRR